MENKIVKEKMEKDQNRGKDNIKEKTKKEQNIRKNADGEKAAVIRLRAHHMMCIPMYQGRGYSEAFCAHMAQVKRELKEKSARIALLARPDVVCSGCPKLRADVGMEAENPVSGNRSMSANCGRTGQAIRGNQAVADRGSDPPKLCSCENETRVAAKDMWLLKQWGLEAEVAYDAETLFAALTEQMTEEKFLASCSKCEWFLQGLCDFSQWKEKLPMTFADFGVLYDEKYKKNRKTGGGEIDKKNELC